MNNESFIKDLEKLLQKHNLYIEQNIKLKDRSQFVEYADAQQKLEIVNELNLGYGRDTSGPFLIAKVSYTQPVLTPHESTKYYGGVAVDSSRINSNKKVPTEFKNLINHINKTHRGVGGF